MGLAADEPDRPGRALEPLPHPAGLVVLEQGQQPHLHQIAYSKPKSHQARMGSSVFVFAGVIRLRRG